MPKKSQETLESKRIKTMVEDNPDNEDEVIFEPKTEEEIKENIDTTIQTHEKEIAKKLGEIRKIRQKIASLRKNRKELRFVRIRVPAEKKKIVQEKIKEILKEYGGDVGGE